MKVRFLQSGGLAGLVRGCTLDTDALPPAGPEELERLVRQSSISGTRELLSDSARDLFQYEIRVEQGSRKASLTVDDANVPEAVRPLLLFLKKHARPVAVPDSRPQPVPSLPLVVLIAYAFAYPKKLKIAAMQQVTDGLSEDGTLRWRILEGPTGDLTIRFGSDELSLENAIVRLALEDWCGEVILRRVTSNQVGAESTIPKEVRTRLPKNASLRLEMVGHQHPADTGV